MAVPELLSAQRDFSAGEIDPELKRRDDLPIYKAGGRQMRDWRILNSGLIEQRPGRGALYFQTGRVDQIQVSATLIYDLCFGGDGSFSIRNAASAVVATQPGATYPWATDTVQQIVWTQVIVGANQVDVVITFPGMKPQVASFDGVVTWTFAAFAFASDATGIALVPFFRVAAPGATMKPSATGAAGAAITILFDQPVLLPAHVGTLFRFAGRRIRIDVVTDAMNANATCLDALLRTQTLTVAKPDGAIGGTGIEGFSLGQQVEGSTSGTKGEVVGINLGANQLSVQLTNFASGFIVSAAGPPVITELVIGPSGKSKVTAAADVAPLPAVSWDEQLMSDARGWAQSCSNDDGRLILCDLPSTPSAIAWSVTGQPYNFTIGANPTDAICELIAGRPRVYHVAPWLDEIVFTNQGIFYVPINTTNPLKPGSVAFKNLSPEPSSSVKPLFTSDGYLYVNAGRTSVKVIVPDGSSLSTRPYTTTDVTQFHKHLFAAGPVAIALSTGDGQFPERYVYVVNADGSVATGKYETGKQWVGWVPWGGAAAVKWISALHSAVRFVSVYPVLGAPAGISVAEVLDDTQYLDAAILINVVPSPPGKGPFFWVPLGNVDLMDGVKPLGSHAIDPNGFIVPAYEGEDLSSLTIMGGFAFQPTFEPFIPSAQPGQDQKQRTLRRNLGRIVVSVMNSTGLVIASLYSGKTGPNLPAQGSIMKQFRIPPWMQGENQALAPPLREDTYRQRFSGRAFDQRTAVFKDFPGPLRIVEVAAEASV